MKMQIHSLTVGDVYKEAANIAFPWLPLKTKEAAVLKQCFNMRYTEARWKENTNLNFSKDSQSVPLRDAFKQTPTLNCIAIV